MRMNQFARLACKRYKDKNADTFVIIYGLPRSGKTTLGFDILIEYLKVKSMLYTQGKSNWDPDKSWKALLRKFFAMSSSDANKKMKANPPGSFTFIDEGIDVVSWHQQMTYEQKSLIELIQKTGKRGNLTLLLTPSFKLLTKEILARAHYLFLITTEPTKDGNAAYLFKNHTIPFLAEDNPFGLNDFRKELGKHPNISNEVGLFHRYLRDKKRMVSTVWFRNVDPRIYNLYDTMVKEPAIMKDDNKRKPMGRLVRNDYIFSVLLWNMHKNKGIPIDQIATMFLDKFGKQTATETIVRTRIRRIENMASPVEYDADTGEEISMEKEREVEEMEDFTLDEMFREGKDAKHADAVPPEENGPSKGDDMQPDRPDAAQEEGA